MPYHANLAHGTAEVLPTPTYAPYFFEVDIEYVSLGTDKVTASQHAVTIEYEVLDQAVLIAEARYELKKELSEDILKIRNKINTAIKQHVLQKLSTDEKLLEEYSIYVFTKLDENPEDLIHRHRFLLTRLMRSIENRVTPEDADKVLSSRVRYSESDMTVIDWEGAVIIADQGEFQSDIEILKIGNYQLLRYRMLDEEIDESIKKIHENLYAKRKRVILRDGNQLLKTIIEKQLELLLHFNKIDQSLLLIGDWYSAKLYRVIVEEFYIDDWKAEVKEKLQNLSTLEEVVRQQFTVTWDRLFDVIQLVGWFILLIGYFVLYFFDAGV
jgi:hypothetical protein